MAAASMNILYLSHRCVVYSQRPRDPQLTILVYIHFNGVRINLIKDFIVEISNWRILFTGIVRGQQYTDCERPPPVEKATAELYIDDEGTFATATYTCATGYQLHGEPEVICNADTDTWKGDLPICKSGTFPSSSWFINNNRRQFCWFIFVSTPNE